MKRAPRNSFAAWKKKAQKEADALFDGNLGDIWAAGDDYDLVEAAKAAFLDGQSPEAFILVAFAEDLARQEAEEQEYEDSLRESDYSEEEYE